MVSVAGDPPGLSGSVGLSAQDCLVGHRHRDLLAGEERVGRPERNDGRPAFALILVAVREHHGIADQSNVDKEMDHPEDSADSHRAEKGEGGHPGEGDEDVAASAACCRGSAGDGLGRLVEGSQTVGIEAGDRREAPHGSHRRSFPAQQRGYQHSCPQDSEAQENQHDQVSLPADPLWLACGTTVQSDPFQMVDFHARSARTFARAGRSPSTGNTGPQASLLQGPERPPDFSQSATSVMLIDRSIALHMS